MFQSRAEYGRAVIRTSVDSFGLRVLFGSSPLPLARRNGGLGGRRSGGLKAPPCAPRPSPSSPASRRMQVCEAILTEVVGGSLSVVLRSSNEETFLLLKSKLCDNEDAVRVALYNAVDGPTVAPVASAAAAPAAAATAAAGSGAAGGSGAAPDDGPYAGARGAATGAAPGRRQPCACMKEYWAEHEDQPPPPPRLLRPPPLANATGPAASTTTAEVPRSESKAKAWLRAGTEARLKAPPLRVLEHAWSQRDLRQ